MEGTMLRLSKSFRDGISAQKKRLSIVLSLIIITAVFVGFQLTPLFESPEALALEYGKPIPEHLLPDYLDAVKKAEGGELALGQPFVFDINWLVSSSYQRFASTVRGQIHWRHEIKPFVRRERFALVVLLLAIVVSVKFVCLTSPCLSSRTSQAERPAPNPQCRQNRRAIHLRCSSTPSRTVTPFMLSKSPGNACCVAIARSKLRIS
jgi:hypothetical protein